MSCDVPIPTESTPLIPTLQNSSVSIHVFENPSNENKQNKRSTSYNNNENNKNDKNDKNMKNNEISEKTVQSIHFRKLYGGYGVGTQIEGLKTKNWPNLHYWDFYYWALHVEWRTFFIFLILFYFSSIFLFALFAWPWADTHFHPKITSFIEVLSFQIQFLTGYGNGKYTVVDNNDSLQVGPSYDNPLLYLFCIESLYRLFYFSILTGLIYARVAKPKSRIRFTDKILFSRTENEKYDRLIFRIANDRLESLINSNVSVVLSLSDVNKETGERWRRFHDLKLIRSVMPNFALPWTIYHIIDENSPLFGKTKNDLYSQLATIFVTIQGMDLTFNSPVYGRTEYMLNDMIWGYKWEDLFKKDKDGVRTIDMEDFNKMIKEKEN